MLVGPTRCVLFSLLHGVGVLARLPRRIRNPTHLFTWSLIFTRHNPPAVAPYAFSHSSAA